MKNNIQFIPAGDQALVVEFGQVISPEISQQIRQFMNHLEKDELYKEWNIRELLPTYRSVLMLYDPLKTDFAELQEKLQDVLPEQGELKSESKRTILIPTCYEEEFGPDIAFVAEHAGISIDEVIQRHSAVDYLVYMLGFTPGFTYLGGLDTTIATPRLAQPRIKIPAGSVGIADQQTGIYPIDSPGGWQLIGRTPLHLYTPDTEPPVLMRAGDYVRFKPVSKEEYLEIEQAIEDGTYSIEIIESGEQQEEKSNEEQKSVLQESVENQSSEPTEKLNSIAIKVKKAGLLSTIQDEGRYGYQQFGVAVGGAMDQDSFLLANELVGNKDNQWAIEMNYLGGQFVFQNDTIAAITGADMQAKVNGRKVNRYEALFLHKGDELTFDLAIDGARTYLSIQGVVDIPKVLGSFSTYTRGKMGGFQGRPLQDGDELHVKTGIKRQAYKLPEIPAVAIKDTIIVRCVVGPQAEAFEATEIEKLFQSEYTVTDQSDRMGYRLEGEPIKHLTRADIISDGILFGSIQIPGNGQPTIMMADHQTTGGYTKIATAITPDLPRLAQAIPGTKIKFEKVSAEEAVKLYRAWQQERNDCINSFMSIEEETMRKDFDIDDIGKLLDYFSKSGVGELQLDIDDFHIELKKNKNTPKNVGNIPSTKEPVIQEVSEPEVETVAVEAPISGVCYVAPGEKEPPFVQVGDIVEAGQTLLIIEVMKLMNEVKAPCAGKIHSILFENEQRVDAGTLLIKIEE